MGDEVAYGKRPVHLKQHDTDKVKALGTERAQLTKDIQSSEALAVATGRNVTRADAVLERSTDSYVSSNSYISSKLSSNGVSDSFIPISRRPIFDQRLTKNFFSNIEFCRQFCN